MENIKYKLGLAAGQTDDGKFFLDFSASAFDPVEYVYVDMLDGVIWLTGAGLASELATGIVPAPRSLGIRYAEHTLSVEDKVTGAQIAARLLVPGMPREQTSVVGTIGDCSGVADTVLWTSAVNVTLYH